MLNQVLTFGAATSPENISGAARFGLAGLQSLSVLMTLVFGGFMQAVITRAMVIEHEDGRPSFGQCMAEGLRFTLPIVALTILWWIGIAIGLVFLLVPGIMLICVWAVAIPALVEDRTGITGAFGRSRELTRGYRWKVLGILIVLTIIYYLVMAVMGIIGFSTSAAGLTDFSNGPPVIVMIATAIGGVVFNLLWSTLQPSLFLELRDAKEGGSAGDLQQVFS